MTLNELEQTVTKLPPEQLAKFRQWFLQFDSDRWDEQISADANSGQLDAVARDALKEFHDGQTRPL